MAGRQHNRVVKVPIAKFYTSHVTQYDTYPRRRNKGGIFIGHKQEAALILWTEANINMT